MAILLIFISYSIAHNLPFPYFLCGMAFLAIGLINPLIGLFIAYALMNNMFNLVPRMLSDTLPINKMWDFGFFLMLLYALPLFLRDYKPYPYRNWPAYLKVLFLFLVVCLLSFLYTLFSYKYPFVDALRMVRPYFGYLAIFILLQFFLKEEGNAKRFFNVLYFILFGLLVLYHIQFILQKEIFFGYQQTMFYKGTTILRSIPNFMAVICVFLWYNLAAWVQGKPMLKYGKIFSLLVCTGTMLSFTRGFYIAFLLSTLLLVIILYFQRKIFFNRAFFLLLFVGCFVFFAALSGYLQPVIERALSIKSALVTERNYSTFGYRLKLLESRFEMTMDRNPFLGVGFVHPKYGRDFGAFPGNPSYEDARFPSLMAGDIEWANIILQTGIMGLASFLLFVLCLLRKYPRDMNLGQTNFIVLLEIAAYIELFRNIITMFISSSFTSDTQNVSLLLAFLAYTFYKGPQQGLSEKEQTDVFSEMS